MRLCEKFDIVALKTEAESYLTDRFLTDNVDFDRTIGIFAAAVRYGIGDNALKRIISRLAFFPTAQLFAANIGQYCESRTDLLALLFTAHGECRIAQQLGELHYI